VEYFLLLRSYNISTLSKQQQRFANNPNVNLSIHIAQKNKLTQIISRLLSESGIIFKHRAFAVFNEILEIFLDTWSPMPICI